MCLEWSVFNGREIQPGSFWYIIMFVHITYTENLMQEGVCCTSTSLFLPPGTATFLEDVHEGRIRL